MDEPNCAKPLDQILLLCKFLYGLEVRGIPLAISEVHFLGSLIIIGKIYLTVKCRVPFALRYGETGR